MRVQVPLVPPLFGGSPSLVRQRVLIPLTAGSNPAPPTNHTHTHTGDMMSRYLSKNLFDILTGENRNIVIKLINNSLIKEARQNGGIIAGGFPRAILLGLDLKQYFSITVSDESGNSWAKRPGDIDIFFPDSNAVKKIMANHVLVPSVGGFAKTAGMHIPGVLQTIQMQLVDHPALCKPTMEQILDGFDFENVKIAIVGEKIFYPEGWFELEETKLVKITSNSSPFMGTRLARYLSTKNLVGITEDSLELLSEWLIRASIKKFPDHNDVHMDSLKSSIFALQKLNQIQTKDLILFLNKWQILTYPKSEDVYGPVMPIAVDWAITQIEEERRARLDLV